MVKANGTNTDPLIIESTFDDRLPSANGPVFLELDYRTSVSFRVGLVATTNSGISERIGLVIGNPSPKEWKKVYVDLTSLVNNLQYRGAKFRVFNEGTRNSIASDFIALDNVRILRFN